MDTIRLNTIPATLHQIVKLSSRDVLIFVILLTVCLRETGAMCRPRFTPMMVHFEDCIPTRVLAKGCYGQCSPSNGRHGNNEDCCVPRETIRRRVRLYCPSSESGVIRYVETFKNVTVPRSCQCEMCVPND